MDCRTDNLCGYVDIWFKWSFSLEFLLAFQEYSISDFEFVFLSSVSSVMVTLQFLFELGVSLPDFFIHVCCLCWIVVKFGTNCSVHE